MEENHIVEDPGRADYVPKGEKKKYQRRFKDGDKVWMKVSKSTDVPQLPDIVVYVREAEYDEAKEGWVYSVQEKDKEGAWYGREKWKRETALKRA